MKFRTFSAVLVLLLMTACNGTIAVGLETATGTPQAPAITATQPAVNPVQPTDTSPVPTIAAVPSNTPAPATTATPAPSNTPVPVVINTAVPNPVMPNYIDDRSTPSQVIVSLYNAIKPPGIFACIQLLVKPFYLTGRL